VEALAYWLSRLLEAYAELRRRVPEDVLSRLI
jgi:hypothetical protein